MKHSLTAVSLAVLAILGMLANVAAAVTTDEFRMIGLATHQETGREIYLGALHIEKLTPRPDNLLASPGPMVMEYRIVARRTSVRSLLGGMLLQGELASGNAPSQATQNFVSTLMNSVQGSLYSGDQLKIGLTSTGQTIARLNESTLGSVDDSAVFYYFLNGWLAEQGPSTAFRSAILAPSIDSSQLTIYEAHTPTQQRIAQTKAWNESPEPGQQAEPQTQITPLEESESLEIAAEQPERAAQAIALTDPVIASPSADSAPTTADLTAEGFAAINSAKVEYDEVSPETSTAALAVDAPEETQASEPVQLASITPSSGLLDERDTVEAMDVIEYSSRLSKFNSQVLQRVTSKLRYPKAAVRRNLQGKLELDLVITGDGALQTVEIASSSGHGVLDKSAVRAAESAWKDDALKDIDAVAIAEYADGNGNIVVPVPVNFVLME